MLGGMSWTSTETYYRLLNAGVAERLGGLHSARLLLHSVDFDEIAHLQHAGEWERTGDLLGEAARGLADAGAEAVLIATNTMHKVADRVETDSGLPVLHIVDGTAAAIRAAGLGRVGLVATAFTMEDGFYTDRMVTQGVETLVPTADQRAEVHRIIYDELVQDVVRPESAVVLREVMTGLVAGGAEGIVLGCTELGLLVTAADVSVPVFDSTRLHAAAGVDWLLAPR